jgi:hypothetical protein
MKLPFTRLAALAALFAACSPLSAATPTFSDDVVFTFTPDAGTKEVVDTLSDIKNNNSNISLRPNGGGEFHLYVRNPARPQKTYTVELVTGPKSALGASVKVTIPGEKWKRVRFAKPALPALEPVAPAVVPAIAPVPAAALAPKVELPAGLELPQAKEGFRFILRLLDDAGDPVIGSDKKELGRVCSVTLLQPSQYLNISKPSLSVLKDKDTAKAGAAQIRVPVSAIAGKASGEAIVALTFPATLNSPTLVQREGVYRRAISLGDDVTVNKSVTLLGNVQKMGDALRAEVSIDGISRAFIYTSQTKAEVKNEDWQRFDAKLVRILRPTGFGTRAVTRPTAAFPIKIEADNAEVNSSLELQIRQAGVPDEVVKPEIVPLKGSREERVWIQLEGKLDKGFAIANRSADWIVPLDLGERRGRVEVVSILRGSDGKEIAKSDPYLIAVDAAAPEDVKFLKLPAKHIKGTPLPVSAALQDNDTRIVKAIFFLGELGEDGKLPEGPKVIGVQLIDAKTKLATVEWIGLMPLPPEKRGEITIGVVAIDEVGNTTVETQKVELVDPPLPSGTIAGKVVRGERAQPGLTVTLLDAEAKPKGETTTDAFGKFKFEKVAPGAYVLRTTKTDPTTGMTGLSPVQVENGKTVKPVVELVHNK